MNFLDKWNKAKFNAYDSEEKTVLKLITKISNFIGELAKGLDDKTDLNGDHKGTWQGLDRPTLSEEGMRSTVEKLDNIYNTVLNDVDIINDEITIVKDEIDLLNETTLNIMKMQGGTKEQKLINALNYAQNNNYKKIFIPSGVYNFKNITADTITLLEGFNQLIIEGENTRSVIFNYNESHINKPFLKVRGGSGQLSQGYIKNITFIGNNTTTAIQLNNVCGYRVINCKFETNLKAIEVVNTESGFTEMCVAEKCDFTAECEQSLVYKKVGTERSFHGTGLKECTINQHPTSTKSNIEIGDGCLPYNAPLDFQIWTRTTTPIIENLGNNISSFYGGITVECFGGEVELVSTARNGLLYSSSHILSNNQNLKLGNLVDCYRIQQNSDGSVTVLRKPHTTVKRCTNNTEITVLDAQETLLIDVRLTAPNFEQQRTYIATMYLGSNDGGIKEIATLRDFNSAGFTTPVFQVVNNRIYLTNDYTNKNVDIIATITHLNTRASYLLN